MSPLSPRSVRDRAGRLRVIGISAPEWLAPPFNASPTWREQGVDCVIGAWRGVATPAGIGPAAVAFWKTLLTAVTSQPSWQTELAARSWSPMYLTGSEVQAYLPEEAAGMTAIFRELGLLRAPKVREERPSRESIESSFGRLCLQQRNCLCERRMHRQLRRRRMSAVSFRTFARIILSMR
jgi:hypothetical protein